MQNSTLFCSVWLNAENGDEREKEKAQQSRIEFHTLWWIISEASQLWVLLNASRGKWMHGARTKRSPYWESINHLCVESQKQWNARDGSQENCVGLQLLFQCYYAAMQQTWVLHFSYCRIHNKERNHQMLCEIFRIMNIEMQRVEWTARRFHNKLNNLRD